MVFPHFDSPNLNFTNLPTSGSRFHIWVSEKKGHILGSIYFKHNRYIFAPRYDIMAKDYSSTDLEKIKNYIDDIHWVLEKLNNK